MLMIQDATAVASPIAAQWRRGRLGQGCGVRVRVIGAKRRDFSLRSEIKVRISVESGSWV